MKPNFWVKTASSLAFTVLLASTTCSGFSARAAETPAATTASVGNAAPAFTLTDSNGQKRSLSDSAGKITVLEWTNFDCPFVKKQYNAGVMQKMQKTYTGKGVVWFSICSSAPDRQGNYSPAKINELIKQNNASPTAYLFDSEGTVGHAYGATATPQMFVINQKGVLVYTGAVDDNPSADITDKAGINYVQKALDETLANKPISVASTKAVGCSVKYAK